jgi:hypothetical protein
MFNNFPYPTEIKKKNIVKKKRVYIIFNLKPNPNVHINNIVMYYTPPTTTATTTIDRRNDSQIIYNKFCTTFVQFSQPNLSIQSIEKFSYTLYRRKKLSIFFFFFISSFTYSFTVFFLRVGCIHNNFIQFQIEWK